MADIIKLQIVSITCNTPSEYLFGTLNDEVFLICQADAGPAIRYPQYQEKAKHPYEDISLVQTMSAGAVWTLDPPLFLEFQNEVLVTLWDRDSTRLPQYDTYLQSNDYQAGTTATTSTSPQSITLKNPNGASYTIVSQVVAPNAMIAGESTQA